MKTHAVRTATTRGVPGMEPTPKKQRTMTLPSSVFVVRNINEIPMPPTRLVKPSKSFSPTAPVPVVAKTEDVFAKHQTGTAADPAASADVPVRVLSVTQAMAKSEMTTGHTVLSSQWFRHPECGLGVWWRMCGQLKDGRIMVDLSVSSFDAALPAKIALCAVQIRITQSTSSGTVSSCFPFQDSAMTLDVDGKERVLTGGGTDCDVDGLDSLVLTMTIAYVEVPAHLRGQPPASSGTDGMFDNKEFGAVNIVLDSGEQVLAHKAVLAGQSSMLRTMFAETMNETTPTRLHVTAVSVDVLTTMLRYMYTGVIRRDPETATRDGTVSLLYLAERFGVTLLKQRAELDLVEFLPSAESDLLQVALTTHAEFLRQVIFIRLSVFAGFSGCADSTQNKEATILTETLRANPDMLQDYFRLNSVAMAPIFKAFSAKDTKALLRSST